MGAAAASTSGSSFGSLQLHDLRLNLLRICWMRAKLRNAQGYLFGRMGLIGLILLQMIGSFSWTAIMNCGGWHRRSGKGADAGLAEFSIWN